MFDFRVEKPGEDTGAGNLVVGKVGDEEVELPVRGVEFKKVAGEIEGLEVGAGGEKRHVVEGTGEGVL